MTKYVSLSELEETPKDMFLVMKEKDISTFVKLGWFTLEDRLVKWQGVPVYQDKSLRRA